MNAFIALKRIEMLHDYKTFLLYICRTLPLVVICQFTCLFFLSQVIYDFIFSLKESPEKFQIVTNFPRRILPCLPTEEQPNPPTLKEAGLSRSEVLFVQDLTDD